MLGPLIFSGQYNFIMDYFHPINWIFGFAASQGIFQAVLLWYKNKKQQPAHYILSGLVFILAVCLIFWLLFWNNIQTSKPILAYLFAAIPFLFGPLLFFYIKTILGRVFSYKDSWHLLPFAIVIVVLSFKYVVATSSNGSSIFSKNAYWGFGIIGARTLLLLMYALYFLKQVANGQPNRLNARVYYLIKRLSWFFLLFAVTFSSAYFIKWAGFGNIAPWVDLITAILIAGIIYRISIFSFNFPDWINTISENTIKKEKKYQRSALSPKLANQLLLKLLNCIETQQLYLEETLSLQSFAQQVDVPKHHISETFNQYLGKNFSQLINDYRVEAAKKILLSPQYNHYTIEAIGYEVGFKSRNTFYQAFKKKTGISPSAYKKRNLDNSKS